MSPVPGNALASGQRLVDALAGISDASADNPYLVKLEPGQFDLGARTLTLRDYVDVEGSGERATTVLGTVDEAVIRMMTLATAELRSLRIRVRAQAGYDSTLVCNDGKAPVLRNVTLEAPDVTQLLWGISSYGCATVLESVTVAGSAVIDSEGGIWGVDFSGGAPAVHDLRVDVSCEGKHSCIGVAVMSNAALRARNSTISITGDHGPWGEAFFVSGADLTLDDVIATAAVHDGDGILGSNDSGSHAIQIEHSTLSGAFDAIAYGTKPGGTATSFTIADSQLGGGKIIDFGDAGKTTFRCVGAYDDQFRALDATCRAPAPLPPPAGIAADAVDATAPLLAAHGQAAARQGILH